MDKLDDSSGIKVQVKKVEQLSSDERASWVQYRKSTEWLDAPFFSPEFVRIVAQLNTNVRVAVIRNGRSIIGFWPFEIHGRTGKPVASIVSEMNGLILNADCQLNLSDLLTALELDRWRFDCVPLNQHEFAPHVIRKTESHYVSIREGFDHYRQFLGEKGTRQFHDNERKLRKIEREHGAVTWVWHQSESTPLDLLTKWKRDQYRRTGMCDVLGIPLVQSLLRNLIDQRTESFGGVLSCLEVGGKIVAIHYGLRDNCVMTSWFHAYDPQFAAYSPGRIGMFKLIEKANEHGIERIDFGQGDERYKLSLSNGCLSTGEGVVSRRKVDRMLTKTWIRTREMASTNAYFQVPLKWFRRLRNWHMGVSNGVGPLMDRH
jgi:CelD/BcsL family acetyltransferase involved in cellulose biosynthesis